MKSRTIASSFFFHSGSCKWLSVTLGVDVASAREMMSRFLSAHRTKTADKDDADESGSRLTATFCLAGESADPATGNPQIQLRLVQEAKLEQVKKNLAKVIGVYVYRYSSSVFFLELNLVHCLIRGTL